jgi:hypothetical protein
VNEARRSLIAHGGRRRRRRRRRVEIDLRDHGCEFGQIRVVNFEIWELEKRKKMEI